MSERRYRMLFSSGAYFGIEDLRRATLASVFAADDILVPSQFQIDPSLDEEERLWLQRRLHTLREMGALKAWAVDQENNIFDRVPTEQLITFTPEIVLPREKYVDLVDSVQERLMSIKLELLPQVTNFEGITEIALGKQTIFKLDLATALGADRLLIGQDARGTFSHFLSELARPEAARYEKFEEKILDQVVAGLNLPDVSLLTADELERCRRLMPAFRRKFVEKHGGRFREIGLEDLTKVIAEEIVSEFNDAILERAGSTGLKHLGEEIAWDILEYLLPPLIVAKYAGLFSRLREERNGIGPLLLLLRLKRWNHLSGRRRRLGN